MDMEYMSQLMLSVLIFAPGVMVLVVCGLIGVAVLLEKAGILAGMSKEVSDDIEIDTFPQEQLPSPGVVSSLSEAIAAEAEHFRDGTNN